MQIILYSTGDDPRKVSKTLTAIQTIEGTLKEESTVVDPEFHISYTTNVFSANYFYVPDFKRYYFLKNSEAEIGGRFLLKGHVDALMSFKDGVLACKGVAGRQTNNYNLYQEDSAFTFRADNRITLLNLPTQIPKNNRFILAVTGG